MKTTRAKKKPDQALQDLPADPCLIMLREAAIAEREAILFYLEAATIVCGDLRRLFLDTAKDEMEHFAMTMRHISALDPVQAEALAEVGLDSLLMQRAMPPKWAAGWQPDCIGPHDDADPADVAPTTERSMTAVCLLTKALTSELEAINTYQKYMARAEDSACCRHFCYLMNDEKEHAASFTVALFDQTGEPSREE